MPLREYLQGSTDRAPRFFYSLRWRLLVLAFLCVLPALAIVIYTGIEFNRRAVEKARENALRVARFASASEERATECARQLLLTVAELPLVRSGRWDRCSALFAKLIQISPGYANLGLVAPDGEVVTSAISHPGRVSAGSRPWFQRAIASRGFVAGDYQVGQITHKQTINFACPVFGTNGTIEAVAFAAVDLNWLEQITARDEIPIGATVVLFDPAGSPLIVRPKRPGAGRPDPGRTALSRAISQHAEGTLEARDPDGTQRLWAYAPLFGTASPGGTIAVGIPWESAFAESRRHLVWAFAALGLIAILGFAAAWIGSDVFVVRRVEALIDTSKRLAAGELGARTGLHRNRGELGELAGVLDDMASALERREHEIQSAEHALRESEARFRTMADSAPVLIWLAKNGSQRTFFNRTWLEFTGRAAARELGSGWLDGVHPEDREQCEALLRAAPTASSFQLEYRLRRQDGEFRWVLDSGSPLRSTEGDFIGYAGSAVDISERKHAEQRLAAQYEFTRALAESASLAESAPKVLRALCEAFGWGAGALWKVDAAAQALRPVEVWAVARAEARALAELSRPLSFAKGVGLPGKTWESDAPLVLPDLAGLGSPRRAELAAEAGFPTALAIPISSGKEVLGVLEFFRTETRAPDPSILETSVALARQLGEFVVRKRGEEMEGRLLRIIESTKDLIGFSDPEGRILYTNRAGRRLLGLSETEDITTTRVGDYLSAASTENMMNVGIPVAIRDGVWEGESTMHDRDGREFLVSQVVIAHFSPRGEVEYLSTVARDMTERARLEGQLRHAQKMEAIGRLAGGIAHDFNNLLTAVQGFSDLALQRLDDKERLARDIGEIKRAGLRAAALTRQLLIFSRQQVLEPQILNLNELVTELAKMLRRLIGEDVELELSCGENLGYVKADPGQIEQVITNLAVNSRDAMPEGGKLFIETSNVEVDESCPAVLSDLKPGPYVALSVSDTGIGMDAETRARIFEPFFTTKEAGKGTGLGLATVYGIVKQCGGGIQVWSEPGHGATFKILLPRSGETGTEARRGAETPSRYPSGSETVLVIEDEEAVRSIIRRTLERCGYNVVEARHGPEALLLSQAASGPIHLVISDMVMPQMNGPEAVQRLLRTRPNMKVLYISGYAERSMLEQGLMGGVGLLHKPFGTEALARKVREVLDAGAHATSGP